MKHTEFNVERMLSHPPGINIIEVQSVDITPEEFDKIVRHIIIEMSAQSLPNMSLNDHQEVGWILGTFAATLKCNLFCIPEREED